MWARLGNDKQGQALQLAMISALALGLFLRVYLYAIHPSTLWEDEAYWAWKTLTLPVLNQTFRPPGFLLLTKGLVTWLGPSELTFRALPFLASLASLLAIPYVASQLFRSKLTRLVVVTIMATHPAALTMAVEFKQYGVEIGVLTVVLASYLRYRERPTKQSLGLLLGLAWAAFFFSIIIIFVYPALFAVLAWDAFKSKQLRVLALVAGAAVLCVATILTIYFTTWRHFNQDRAEKKWGTKYDVFYVPNADESRTAWTLKKYSEVAALPDFGRERWRSSKLSETTLVRLADADRFFWLGLHGLGVFWLIHQRRLRELAWLWSPLWMMTVFSLAGRWPAGAFRTNAGILPFTLFLAAFGLDAATALRPQLARLLLPLGCVLALAPPLVMRPDWFRKGCFARAGQFDEVFETLLKSPAKPGRTVVLMENSSCRPWTYYTRYDSPAAKTTAPKIRARFTPKCAGNTLPSIAKLASAGSDFWIVLTDRRKDSSVDKATRRYCKKVARFDVAEGLHGLWHCDPKNRRRD
jgi:4-amino-4-deoxy-L-arabinose transferase-like glycosyltransferase